MLIYAVCGHMKIITLLLYLMIFLVCPNVVKSESVSTDALINEIRVGIMKHDVATNAQQHEDGQDFNSEFFFRAPRASLMELMGSPRPSLGLSVNNSKNTSQFYTGLNWDVKFFDLLFLSFGVGGAVHNGELQSSDPDRQRLGSRALFRAAIAAGFKFNKRMNVSVLFDHVSNGRLAYPNNGLEKLGIQFGYTY